MALCESQDFGNCSESEPNMLDPGSVKIAFSRSFLTFEMVQKYYMSMSSWNFKGTHCTIQKTTMQSNRNKHGDFWKMMLLFTLPRFKFANLISELSFGDNRLTCSNPETSLLNNTLVVSTHLKTISQIDSFPQVLGWKFNKNWNHHIDNGGYSCSLQHIEYSGTHSHVECFCSFNPPRAPACRSPPGWLVYFQARVFPGWDGTNNPKYAQVQLGSISPPPFVEVTCSNSPPKKTVEPAKKNLSEVFTHRIHVWYVYPILFGWSLWDQCRQVNHFSMDPYDMGFTSMKTNMSPKNGLFQEESHLPTTEFHGIC